MQKLLRIFFTYALLLVPHLLFSQSWEWAKNAGGGIGTTGDGINNSDIVTDIAGNSYVSGFFNGVVTLGNRTLTSTGGSNMFLAKYDGSGNIIWIQTGGVADAQHLAADAQGNIYVAGYFYGSATFGSTTLNAHSGSSNSFIAKYNPNGELIWARNITNKDESLSIRDIAVNSVGNVHITGTFLVKKQFGSTTLTAPEGSSAYFFAKFDASGNPSWGKALTDENGSSVNIAGMGIDASDNIYLTGRLYNSVTFESTLVAPIGNNSIYLAKYDKRGSLYWAKVVNEAPSSFLSVSGLVVDPQGNSYLTGGFRDASLGETILAGSGRYLAKFNSDGSATWAQKAIDFSYISVYSGIAVNSSGNVYLTDIYYGNITFQSITLTPNTGSSSDIYIAKYNQDGTIAWAKNAGGVGSTYVDALSVDAAGNSYVTGSFSGTSNFNTISLTANSSSDNNMFIAKFNTSGTAVWAKSAGGTGADQGSGIATDANGNSYVTGFFAGTTTFGNTTFVSSGSEDIFMVKYRADGSVLWAVKAGGAGSDRGVSVTVDKAGNSYITGTYKGTATFGAETLTATDNGQDLFLAKYDPAGNLLWARSAGGYSSETVRGITVDAAGNTLVTGNFSGEVTFEHTTLNSVVEIENHSYGYTAMFLAKYDADGNVVWATKSDNAIIAQSESSSYCRGNALVVDSIGNIFVTGLYYKSVLFGSIILNGIGNYDFFVAKYDPSGNVMWAKSVGGLKNDAAESIELDASGNLYITGAFSGDISFGSTSLTSNGGGDMFVAKLDNTGNVLWAKNAGGAANDSGFGISTDAQGNSYITGYISDAATFGGISLPGSGMSLFVAKYDTDGNVLWAQKPSAEYSQGRGISIDAAGNSYITGSVNGSATFDGASLNTVRDILVAKLAATSITLSQVASTYCVGSSLNVPFTTTGSFKAGNTYAVELSDATGSFASPVVIGSGTASPLTATLPANLTGSGYKIRVVASAPQINSAASNAISISAIPNAPTVPTAAICGSGSVILTATGAVAGQSYRWYASATATTALATTATGTFTTPTLTSSKTYYVAIANSQGCESSRTEVAVSVTAPVSNNKLTSWYAACEGQHLAMITGSMPNGGDGTYSYQWLMSTDAKNYIPIPGAISADYQPGVLTAPTTWFRRVVSSGTCAQSTSNTTTYVLNATPVRPSISKINNTLQASTTGSSYEWYLDGKRINYDTQTIPSGPGAYMVRVQNESGCLSEFSEKFEPEALPTAIGDVKEAFGLTAYPNPSQGKVIIATDKPLSKVAIQVLNTTGYQVYEKNLASLAEAYEIDLSHLAAGMYFIRVSSSSGQVTRKLILEKN